MADVDVIEARDCPVCGEPMEIVFDFWVCIRCGGEDDNDESD